MAMLRALTASALLCALGGCATREVIYHRLPDDTPAADNAAAIRRAEEVARQQAAAKRAAAERAARKAAEQRGQHGAGAGPGEPQPAQAPLPQALPAQALPPITPDESPPLRTYDPLARLNRFDYRLNARFDRLVFVPVADHYRMLPSPVQAGVHNFFGNLTEIDSIINYTLQGRLGRGVRSLGRFVVNSTLGIGGLIDVAGRLNLPARPTGFGTTLAKWGMHPGAYLVIPLYGPSSVREGIGLAADYAALYEIDPIDLYRGAESWGLGVANAVDQRAHVSFEYYDTGSPFEYEMIRFLYVRKLLIEDSALHPPSKSTATLPAGE